MCREAKGTKGQDSMRIRVVMCGGLVGPDVGQVMMQLVLLHEARQGISSSGL